MQSLHPATGVCPPLCTLTAQCSGTGGGVKLQAATEGAAPLRLMLDRLKELELSLRLSLRLFLFLCLDHNRKLTLTGLTRERLAASPYVSVLRARERLMGILSLVLADPPALPPLPSPP